ncbi:MAG: electron transport complex subunit RsxC [Bacillota bacterium]|nr:electron transport complex subunit RsxC [Bacillota bacterium]
MTFGTFQAGIHPPYFKEASSGREIRDISLPEEVVIPLHQHTGVPCDPLVKVGDHVLVGQKIGDSKAFVTAPVHASVSGEVKAVEPRPYFTGANVMSVVIATDGEQESASLPGGTTVENATPGEIKKAAREAGLVGMGGAAFPTAVKLSPPQDKPIDTIVINGCECEPFLTCDHRIMLERADDMIAGSFLIMKAVGAGKCVFGVENNKPDVIELLSQKIKDRTDMAVIPLETKYPQGSEKQLIKATLNREVPPGKLPMEVGTVVNNVQTAVALLEAVTTGRPLIDRVLTVAGPAAREPQNVRVKIGTPVKHVLSECGGVQDAAKVILGGPMTGWAQSSLDVPVVKGTSGILALTPQMARVTPHLACVRCGKCVEHCPVMLYPNFIGVYAEAKIWDKAEAWNVLDCFECGVCAYVCPSKRPLVQFVRFAKAEVLARRQAGR